MDLVKHFYGELFLEQEWGLYANGVHYAIATANKIDAVESPLEDVIWKIHSHSDTPPTDREEIRSMGYWFYYEDQAFNADGKLINKRSPWYEANPKPNDLYNLRNHSSISSRVYFPRSGHVYKMNKNSLPSLVETRK